VEDVEVSVLDPNSIEIGRGEGLSMEGGGVFLIALATNANKVSIFVDTPVTNILSSFSLSFLVEEDNRIKVGLSTIILYPPFTRVVGVLKVASKWGGEANRLRGGSGSGDGRLVLSEANGFVTVDTVIIHVRLSKVENVGNEE